MTSSGYHPQYQTYQRDEQQHQLYSDNYPEVHEPVDANYRDLEPQKRCDSCGLTSASYFPAVPLTEPTTECPLIGVNPSQVGFDVGHFKLRVWLCDGSNNGCGKQYCTYHIYGRGVDGASTASSFVDENTFGTGPGLQPDLSTSDQLPYPAFSAPPTPNLLPHPQSEQEIPDLYPRLIPRKPVPDSYDHLPLTHASSGVAPQEAFPLNVQTMPRRQWFGSADNMSTSALEFDQAPDFQYTTGETSSSHMLQVPHSQMFRRHSDAQAHLVPIDRDNLLGRKTSMMTPTEQRKHDQRKRNMDHDNYQQMRRLGACETCKAKRCRCSPSHHAMGVSEQ